MLQYELGRSVEERGGDKKPMIRDLNEHPHLKNMSDAAYYLYRPEYYAITEDEFGKSTKNIAQIGVLNSLKNEEAIVEFKWN